MRQCADCGELIPESEQQVRACPSCRSTHVDEFYGYLPQRISGGSLQPDGLEVVLRDRKELLPWGKIRMICLGILEEPLLEAPSNAYLQMKEAMGRLFSSEAKSTQKKRPRGHEKVYIEVFVSDQEKPFRLESTSINYRGFLPEIDYSSENNLKKLLKTLTEKLPNCKFDKSFLAYLANDKDQVGRYASIYEFQRSCLEQWENEQKESG